MGNLFSKYTPAKGYDLKQGFKEINGTPVFTPKGLAFFSLRVHKDLDTPTNIIRVHNGKNYVDFLDTEIIPAVLSLCTKDIKPGDEIFSYEHPDIEATYGHDYLDKIVVYNEGDQQREMPSFRYKKDFYKVLGKISPGAVWIGEGETFEGDEYSEEGVKYNKTGNMLGQEHNESFYYLIRCPVCKSFH